MIVSLKLWANVAVAADPFRTTDARPIGDRTEAAFRALFEKGDYSDLTRQQLNMAEQAEPNEPLAYALQASMTFIDFQNEKEDKGRKAELLQRLKSYSERTRAAAQALTSTDPLRGNLYTAVSHFLEGGYILLRDGTVKGAPSGLGELQQAFKAMDAAAAIAPNDPELNLIKGFMDLIIAVNLPFSSPTQAIARLEKYAGPKYLAERGIAIGYRDLKQPDKALEAVDRALKLTPNNPELMYLKAQILVRQGNRQASLEWFEKALKQREQLPAATVKQIKREQSRAKEALAGSEKK
jgi:tetratricopeptide (TPR) repeat protein